MYYNSYGIKKRFSLFLLLDRRFCRVLLSFSLYLYQRRDAQHRVEVCGVCEVFAFCLLSFVASAFATLLAAVMILAFVFIVDVVVVFEAFPNFGKLFSQDVSGAGAMFLFFSLVLFREGLLLALLDFWRFRAEEEEKEEASCCCCCSSPAHTPFKDV